MSETRKTCPKCGNDKLQIDYDVFCFGCKSWFHIKDDVLVEWTEEEYRRLPIMDMGETKEPDEDSEVDYCSQCGAEFTGFHHCESQYEDL